MKFAQIINTLLNYFMKRLKSERYTNQSKATGQMNQELMEYCKKEIQELLNKGII